MKAVQIAVILAPLCLAVGAVVARQSTRAAVAHPDKQHESAEFTPPTLFLMAARAPGRDQVFAVDADASVAKLFGADGAHRKVASDGRVTGTATIDAAEARVTLDLVVERSAAPGAVVRPNEWPELGRIALRAESTICRATDAPGTHFCELRARWSVAGKNREDAVEAMWMRLPGNIVRMQLTLRVPDLDGAGDWAARWRREDPVRGELALDVTFQESR